MNTTNIMYNFASLLKKFYILLKRHYRAKIILKNLCFLISDMHVRAAGGTPSDM